MGYGHDQTFRGQVHFLRPIKEGVLQSAVDHVQPLVRTKKLLVAFMPNSAGPHKAREKATHGNVELT